MSELLNINLKYKDKNYCKVLMEKLDINRKVKAPVRKLYE